MLSNYLEEVQIKSSHQHLGNSKSENLLSNQNSPRNNNHKNSKNRKEGDAPNDMGFV